jgi:uncharacterized membrane protein
MVGVSFTAGSGVLNVTAPPNGNIAPPGYYMLFLLNSSGVPSVAKFVQITAKPDFAISATPSSRPAVQGAGTTYTATISALNGFTGSVNLSVSGLPSGASYTFNPTSITNSGNSTLTVNTASTTPAGSYQLMITATSGSLTHTAKVTLVVTADFTLSATPTSRTISRGSSTTYTITVGSAGTFTGTVSLSVTGIPKRASSSFTPSTLTGTGNSTLNINTNRNVPSGTYSLIISGTSGTVSHSTTVGLMIQ